MFLLDMSIVPSQIPAECKSMKEDYNQMIDAIEQAYIRDFEDRQEAARLEAERLERERIERERLETERLAKERIERERLEAERIEQERIEKERASSIGRGSKNCC
jgi:glutamyl-tRNA reductase